MFNQVLLTVVCCSFGYVAPSSVHVNVLQLVNLNIGDPGPSVTLPKYISIGKKLDDLKTNELWLHILHQLDRPYENRSIYRGEHNNVYHLDTETYDPTSTKPDTHIIIPTMKDFTIGKRRFKKLFNYPKGRDIIPSLFDTNVKDAVNELHTVYKEHPGAKGILKVAVNAKDYVNEFIHVHTLMHAMLYDKELNGYGFLPLYEVIPELFSPNPTTEGCNATSPQCCQIDDYPHDLTEDEWKLSYWREDAGLNDFHGSWHYYNPFGSDSEKSDVGNGIPLNQGELFYYMHNQLVARYAMERLSNDMEPVEPLDNWNSSYIIPQNYKPPILKYTLTRCDNQSAGIFGKTLDFCRTNLKNDISNRTLYQYNGSTVHIDNDEGIKYVGCALMRADCGSLNITKYGRPKDPLDKRNYGIHGIGHDILSKMGCKNELEEELPFNVHGGPWITLRDPVFFRWHKFVDDVFQLHLNNLTEYNHTRLGLDGVLLSSVAVDSTKEEGQLTTFNSTVTMTMWLDHTIGIYLPTRTCITQPTINHYPFTYNITVKNNHPEGSDIKANVRIFLAPKLGSAISYEELRTQWVLMDRFNVTLKSGSNNFKRSSCNSSITAPQPKTLQDLSNIYSNETSFNDFRYSFKGPLNNTWGKNQCNQLWNITKLDPQQWNITNMSHQLWNISNLSLRQCQSECLAKPNSSCTALNYNPETKDCVLWNCSTLDSNDFNEITQVPAPQDYTPPAQGYSIITKRVKCHCGLPQHLLIPRGNEAGMPYQLFIYITPKKKIQNDSANCNTQECSDLCAKDYTGCDQSDGEPMGFPFDRPLTNLTIAGNTIVNITSIEDLADHLPNAMLYDIKIFYDKIVQNNTRQCNN